MFYLVGRSDSQIKTRGYRIELGEIEAAVHALAEVQDAAVVAVESDDADTRSIACAYVPQAGTDISPLALKKKLAKVLPSYILTKRWMSLQQLPRNNNGKADRPLLKQQFRQQGAIRHAHGSDSNVREEQRQEPLSVLP